jgi:hypothetical protein
MSTHTARPAVSHAAQGARHAQSARKVAAHRAPSLADSLTLRFHVLAFSFGVTVAAAGGYGIGHYVLGF